jgi:hypothetical protein
MAFPPIKGRTYGYEFSGSEYKLIFEKENMGYVRYKNKNAGIFYLDPSPYYNDPISQVYAVKSGDFPPKGQLIEVTVSETETFHELVQGELQSTLIKYVMGWGPVDPNKIRGNNLTSKDDFLEFLSTPVKYNIIDIDDLQYCLGMCIVSSPQITDLEKGGMNAVVLEDHFDRSKWAAYKRILSVVPKEFKQPASKNFYKFLEDDQQPCPPKSSEVNLSYFDITDVPIHLPIPFNMKLKSYSEYKENFNHYLPLARAYMIDSLLFQPYIPEKIEKRMEEAMYFILDDITSTGMIPYYQDIGSVIPKLATSFARLNFDSWITISDLNKSKGIWIDLMAEARHTVDLTRNKNVDAVYELTSEAEKLRREIIEIDDAGIPLLIDTIRKNTKLMEWTFDKALQKLKVNGYIYFPNNEKIGLIRY